MDENGKTGLVRAGGEFPGADIIGAAKETIKQIYGEIGMVENCRAVLTKLDGAGVVLLLPDGGTAGLEGVLDESQRAGMVQQIRALVEGNIRTAEKRLMGLSGRVSADGQEGDTRIMAAGGTDAADRAGGGTGETAPGKPQAVPDGVHGFADAAGTAGQCKRRACMDIGQVRQMLKDGYSLEDIQQHYGYKTKQSVQNFLKKHGVNPKPYESCTYRGVTAEDEGTIRALYTSGKFGLRETAAELGTSKKLLYEYLQKHPKLIPVRKG